jgi:hypothetical protein
MWEAKREMNPYLIIPIRILERMYISRIDCGFPDVDCDVN